MSKQQENLAKLKQRLEEEPGFKEQLLQEFLDADTDLEIKEKYGLSDYAIKTIRSKYNWGDLIKTTRFSRNWAKTRPERANYEFIIEKAENDSSFKNFLFEEMTKHDDAYITEKYSLAGYGARIIRNYFGWNKEIGQARIAHTLSSIYGEGVTNASHIPHIASKRAHKCKACNGQMFDSSWEVAVYEFCLRNRIPIERNVRIKYKVDDVTHFTSIDFRIGGILFEVKGGHLLNGTFSDRTNVPIEAKIDLYKENHVIVITDRTARQLFGKKDSSESAGLKYPNKCPNPLIGVDIDLFLNPQFPYRLDRPKCFYKVSVNGKPSQIEAFNNERLRWEMIKNRINYVGGFIDSKEVCYALNVTRKSKQPSWFSKSFAKDIITKYIGSDIIVDSFAGWGTRHDASIELGKQYIGIDYSKELVDWHKSMGRNIEFGDANLFTYDGDCSVFICPPYTDIEVYFEDQDLETTQCQWLEIVMRNIPNAREYVMVCKDIDSGWEKYIVETKTNKSHFGTNNEYIIKLTQEEKNRLLNE